MYLKLKKVLLKKIINSSIKKAGSIRKLVLIVNIPRSTIFENYQEKHAIKKDNLNKILNYLEIRLDEKDILKKFPDNWKQIIGGKRCVEIKKANGTYEKQLKKCQQKGGKIYLKKWHSRMKKQDSEKYHILQYERFKKISNYKFETKNKEKVRNKLEKEIADILKKRNIKYKYEPLIKIGMKYFFPDFLINNNIIIECTAWRGYDKATKLKEKIKVLEKEYMVYVVVPKPLKRYYETLNNWLILGTEDLINKIESL
jgi:hypothetical protein